MSINKNDLRLNSQIIKKALNSTYNRFEEFDPKSTERKKTNPIKKEIIKKSGKICAICGKRKKIVAAHIEPLEAGGESTEKNIILLCSDSINSLAPGCHELFDDGLTSIKQIEKLKNRNSPCKSETIRKQMMVLWEKRKIEKRAEDSVRQRISKRHWKIALNLLREKKIQTQNKNNFSIILKEAEINRRRTAREGLHQARKLLNFNKESFKSIPKKLYSRFYYELGYVHLLCGEHDLAAEKFELSEKYSSNPSEKNAAFWLWLNAEIVSRGNQARWDIVEKKIYEIDRNKNQNDSIFSKRIYANGLFNRVRIFLTQKKFKEAKDKLDEALEHWKNIDIESGWEKSSFSTILSIRGQVLLSLDDTKLGAETALKFFSRCIVIMLAGKQVPEGIRDVLFPAAKCLRIMEYNKDADHVEIIASRILDGASFTFPYKRIE